MRIYTPRNTALFETMNTPMEKAIDAVRGALLDNPCVMIEREPLRLHYFSDDALKNALMAGIAALAENCICRWPDKTLREVTVMEMKGDTARIIWNERHNPIEGQGCVVGMEDTVPVAWLYIPANEKVSESL